MYQLEGCPFCYPEDRVLRDNMRANLILSNPRKVEGHCLVIPKRHILQLSELGQTELLDIFDLVKFTQTRLEEAFGAGSDISQHYRPFMPQSRLKIDHLHFHIYPRQFKDELYDRVERSETDLFTELGPEERARISQLFAT